MNLNPWMKPWPAYDCPVCGLEYEQDYEAVMCCAEPIEPARWYCGNAKCFVEHKTEKEAQEFYEKGRDERSRAVRRKK